MKKGWLSLISGLKISEPFGSSQKGIEPGQETGMEELVRYFDILFCVAIFLAIGILYVISKLQRSTWSVERRVAVFKQRLMAFSLDFLRGILIVVIEDLIRHIAFVSIFQEKIYDIQYEPGLFFKIIVYFALLLLPIAVFAYQNTKKQQTWGKRVAGIRLVRIDGNAPTYIQSFTRSILCFVSVFAVFTGFIPVLFRTDRRALHDLLSNTIVVQANC